MQELLVKDPTKIKTTWLLSRDLVKQTKQYALDHDTSVTAIVTEALKDYLSGKNKKNNSNGSIKK